MPYLFYVLTVRKTQNLLLKLCIKKILKTIGPYPDTLISIRARSVWA